MSEPHTLDVAALVEGYRSGAFTPSEVVRGVLDAAEGANPTVNAFCLIDREGAVAAARAASRRWKAGNPRSPLDGVPFTVKDNIAWAGRPLRRGSRSTDAEPAAENAPSVERLIESGAVPFAKTTLPEYGWKGLGDGPLHGITRNPWDVRMTTGGSSAGAAAAAALGVGPLHLGTDGAGSIRIPASFCGLFGLKPSHGRVPAYPPSPLQIVSHQGVLTRTVSDTAAALAVIGTPDARDILGLVTPPQNYLAGIEVGVRGVRMAWSPRLGYVRDLDPEVEGLCRAAVEAFTEAGAIVEEADPGFDDPVDTLNTIWRVGAWTVVSAIPEARWPELDPGFLAEALTGREITTPAYVHAMNARAELSARMARFHDRYEFLLTPTLATPAFEVGRETPADGRFGESWLAWTPYSYPFNLTLQPAASLPCGLTEAGLPVGLQVVGPHQRDGAVLRAARAFEQARPWPLVAKPRRGGA